jgi:hypothetical protein
MEFVLSKASRYCILERKKAGVEFWLPCPDGLLIWTIVSWVEIDDLVII